MIEIKAENYSVSFGEQGFKNLTSILSNGSYSKIFILTDTNTTEYCLPYFLQRLETTLPFEIIEIEDGEANKNIETCFDVWSVLSEFEADRKCIFISLGGGVVTDLGGFVAATYKRGVDFISIPTTLLAMVDASVGGKTGVDLAGLKNQIGLFANPQMVLIDVNFLETLPGNEMRSGLAEMYKHGLIADISYWNQLKDLSNFTTNDLELLIYHSVQLKNEIVLLDPKEKNIRKKLNFGHTLGHAIESYHLNNENITTLLHGEAVAVGMILEANISLQKGFISEMYYNEIKHVLNDIFPVIELSEKDIEECLRLLVHDKKNELGCINFTLIKENGEAIINEEVSTEMIINAFTDYLS
nr:3-dehydroquinate synthase [uncultured Flavobacterium sp.]